MKLKVGAHVSIHDNWALLFEGIGLSTIQVMASNPRTFQYPSKTLPGILKGYSSYTKEPFFIHSPYIVSLVKKPTERQCRFTVDYIGDLAALTERLEIPIRFVTHLGVIPDDMPSYEAYENLMKNLVEIHNRIKDREGNFRVLLENDSGTRNRSKMNTAQGLFWVVQNNEVAKWFKTLWLGFCFDTNHAYGSGFSRKCWIDFISECDVVHYNPIPDFMEIGNNQDRHSEFLLKDSKEKKLLKQIMGHAEKKSIPLILENTGPVIIENLRWIRKNHVSSVHKK